MGAGEGAGTTVWAARGGGGVGVIRVRVCGREERRARGRGGGVVAVGCDVVVELVVEGMAWPKGKREKQRVGEEKRGDSQKKKKRRREGSKESETGAQGGFSGFRLSSRKGNERLTIIVHGYQRFDLVTVFPPLCHDTFFFHSSS